MNFLTKIFRNILFFCKGKLGFDRILFNQGVLHSRMLPSLSIPQLSDASFSVYSQWGEDGIIQYLIRNLNIDNKLFIEFGVETFTESNCRFLLEHDNWSGYVIDGSPSNISTVKKQDFYWRHNLAAVSSFITKENIASLLEQSGFPLDPGIISIDIDGNDWYVLNAISHWRPSIFIVEYNCLFRDQPHTIPYDATFVRSRLSSHNIIYGAGLMSFRLTLESRGYRFVGINNACSNAFFVRNDLITPAVESLVLPQDPYRAQFREYRLRKKLAFITSREASCVLSNKILYNTFTNTYETVC